MGDEREIEGTRGENGKRWSHEKIANKDKDVKVRNVARGGEKTAPSRDVLFTLPSIILDRTHDIRWSVCNM
jgi:hypothetical protein